jgi:hypothetical protein
MEIAIRQWMISLDNYPGWKEWNRRKVHHTLYFDEELSSQRKAEEEFKFSQEVERQHAVVINFLGLQQAIGSLKESEFYFRRYPFHGLPVSRVSHLTNVCEMYFGRFYELKERLKNYFDCVTAVAPNHGLNIGKFIKTFEKVFDSELRARHDIHHRQRFEDVALNRIFLRDAVRSGRIAATRRVEHFHYRETVKEWVQRVRRSGERADAFLEAVAEATLRSCRFLALHLLIFTIAESRGIDLVADAVRRRQDSSRRRRDSLGRNQPRRA